MVKNKYTLQLLLLCLTAFAHANTSKYIVYFKDKPKDTKVEQLFSAKAIEKRKQKHIAFDERDFPINTVYIEQIKNKQAVIVNQSNWLNAALITIDEKKISAVKKMDFVATVTKVEKTEHGGILSVQHNNECDETNNVQDFEDNYTSSFAQFHLLNGEYLHEQGFNGENMTIAICDNGFYNANNNSGFSNIFSESRILGTYDYVHGDSAVYDEANGWHGSNCFSFIGGLKANQYIGTATKANFYLFHTEDNDYEWLQEEFNLAMALERCDQLGVDVVSISLGYLKFNRNTFENHDTSDLRKNITPAAKAVNTASSKGILVCTAAGNMDFGQYINTPADADSAFCIASVNINGVPAGTSSIGLPNDPRIKPNIAAAGQGVNFVDTSRTGIIKSGSGTSYATPSLAGMATCLWQAFPTKTNWEIKTAIEQSASQYLTPDKKIGYGIPDFKRAYEILSLASFVDDHKLEKEFSVYPNPFQSVVNINNTGSSRVQKVQLTNNLGQIVYSDNTLAENTIALNELPKGMYVLQISTSNGLLVKKMLKN